MDLRLPVIYRTFNLTDIAYGNANRPLRGCDLRRINYGDVEGAGYREKRALDDGYDAGTVWLGFRPIEMSGTLYGESLDDLWDRMQKMRVAFTPTLAYADAPGDMGFMPLTFQQHTANTTEWPSSLMDLQMLARPNAQPHFVVVGDRLSGPPQDREAGGFSMEWSVQMWCRDPRIYAQPIAGKSGSQVKAISGLGGVTAGAGTFINRGDYPAALNFILYATSGGVDRTFTFKGAGSDFDVFIPTSVNPRIVRVDSVNKVVTYQEEVTAGVATENLRMDLITFKTGLTWPKVPTSGTLSYTWSCTTPGLAVGSEFFYSEAYA